MRWGTGLGNSDSCPLVLRKVQTYMNASPAFLPYWFCFICSYLLDIFPSLLRYNWRTTLCKFKVYTTRWFDVGIYCKMMTTIRLVNTYIISQSYLLCGWLELLRSTLLATFKYTVWLSPCCTLGPQKLFMSKLEFCTLEPPSFIPLPQTPAPGNHQATLYFCEFSFLKFHIKDII